MDSPKAAAGNNLLARHMRQLLVQMCQQLNLEFGTRGKICLSSFRRCHPILLAIPEESRFSLNRFRRQSPLWSRWIQVIPHTRMPKVVLGTELIPYQSGRGEIVEQHDLIYDAVSAPAPTRRGSRVNSRRAANHRLRLRLSRILPLQFPLYARTRDWALPLVPGNLQSSPRIPNSRGWRGGAGRRNGAQARSL